jgi:3-dehydroquinate synthase
MNVLKIKSRLYNYEVRFVSNIAFELNALINRNKCAFVIDKNVYDLHSDIFKNIEKGDIFFVDAVESKKSVNTCLDLITFWSKRGVRKNHKVICFGGGITQDIVSFSSNMYLRNIDWIFFPTTILAMSDSCIGGKCGINVGEYKNQLGVFYPPKRIFIDKTFLRTLTDIDYINGWGEILKFSLTKDRGFFEEILKVKEFIPCDEIDYFIYRGLKVKKYIIEKDEFESDLRRVLNYGHSFGHALETYSKNKIPHGAAVIWGIDVVNYLAFREKILSKATYMTIKKLIKEKLIPQEITIDVPSELFNILSRDKKVKDNTIYFAFLTKISRLVIYPMELNSGLLSMFKDYLEETHEYYRD